MIPGLENANFLRYGQMHRNTFVFSPKLLRETMQYRFRSNLLFAGQITGIEGYVGNMASGLVAGINSTRLVNGKNLLTFPIETMVGALCHYVTHASEKDFQPMKANYGIMPPLNDGKKRNKRMRAEAYGERSLNILRSFLSEHDEIL